MEPIDPLRFAVASGVAFVLGLGSLGLRPSWVLRSPRAVLALAVLTTLCFAVACLRLDPPGLRLRLDPSTEPLLPRHDPARALHAEAVRHFGNDQVFAIAMQTEDLFQRENLEALRRVTHALSRLEGVRSVQSLLDVYSFRYDADEDWVEVRPFIEEIPEDPAALTRLRERALGHPVYRRTLVSDDGRAAGVNVSFRSMSDAEFIAADLDGRIRRILDAERAGGRRFAVAGRPHVKARVFDGMLRDLRLLIPCALAAMALVAGLAFASRRGVALPLGTGLAGVVWTFGAMALLDRPLSILTVLVGPSLLALGCVHGVHVLSHMQEQAAAEPDPRRAAAAGLAHLVAPVSIAGLTTMAGFAALLLTDVPAVFELGAFSAFGVGVITLFSLTVLPAAVALLPPRREPGERRLAAALDRGVAAVVELATRRSAAVLLVCAALAVLAAWRLPQIDVDTDYLAFFDADAPVRRDFDAVNRALSGAVPLYVPLEGGGPGAFREPELLRRVEALQIRLEALPGVGRVLSLVDTLRVLNRAVEADAPDEERIPDTRAGVAELLFLVPKGELGRFTNVDHSRANLVVRTGEVGSSAVQLLAARMDEAIAAVGFPQGVRAGVTGNALLLARSADGVARGQPRSVVAAALAICVLVTLALGSLRLGLLAMLPNLLPVLLFFGLLGAGVASLSLPTSLIGCVALGIAVDDTAHFLARYRRERRAGLDPVSATRLAGRRVGRAVAVASLALCAGFGVVALSGFASLRAFGVLSAVTMALCLLADLVLLPALLARSRI